MQIWCDQPQETSSCRNCEGLSWFSRPRSYSYFAKFNYQHANAHLSILPAYLTICSWKFTWNALFWDRVRWQVPKSLFACFAQGIPTRIHLMFLSGGNQKTLELLSNIRWLWNCSREFFLNMLSINRNSSSVFKPLRYFPWFEVCV